jgi:hypothetical protein
VHMGHAMQYCVMQWDMWQARAKSWKSISWDDNSITKLTPQRYGNVLSGHCYYSKQEKCFKVSNKHRSYDTVCSTVVVVVK